MSPPQYAPGCWDQAVLPTRYGGLGLRQLADVALPSYVSSLYRCSQLIDAILPPSLTYLFIYLDVQAHPL